MRLFVAIELPDHVRAALAREHSRLRALCPRNREIRWAAPDSLHLTLKFLGEVAPDRVPVISAALESLGESGPFELELNGFGFFPDPRHPRVFWAGFKAPPSLQELASRVDRTLAALGFPPENRAFTPHLTLARFRSPRADPDLVRAVEKSANDSFGRFTAYEYFLFESHLKPSGAEHKKIGRFSLGSRQTTDDRAELRPED